MRKDIFTLLKSHPLRSADVVETLKQPRHLVYATLEIMVEEGLLRKKMLVWDSPGLSTYYGWPKKKAGKL